VFQSPQVEHTPGRLPSVLRLNELRGHHSKFMYDTVKVANLPLRNICIPNRDLAPHPRGVSANLDFVVIGEPLASMPT
jgi:hypothetical protein